MIVSRRTDNSSSPTGGKESWTTPGLSHLNCVLSSLFLGDLILFYKKVLWRIGAVGFMVSKQPWERRTQAPSCAAGRLVRCERGNSYHLSILWEKQPCQVSTKERQGPLRKDLENVGEFAIPENTLESLGGPW